MPKILINSQEGIEEIWTRPLPPCWNPTLKFFTILLLMSATVTSKKYVGYPVVGYPLTPLVYIFNPLWFTYLVAPIIFSWTNQQWPWLQCSSSRTPRRALSSRGASLIVIQSSFLSLLYLRAWLKIMMSSLILILMTISMILLKISDNQFWRRNNMGAATWMSYID